MDIRVHDDVGAFAALAGPLLDADPLRHNVALTVLDTLCRVGEPAAALLTVHEAGEVVGAALRTPSRSVVVSAVPPSYAGSVAAVLAEADPGLPGVTGPTTEAEAFAAAHAARTGARVEVDVRMRLFALGTFVAPVGVPGAARRADDSDLDVLEMWRSDFAEEVHHGWIDPLTPRELAARSLRLGSGELLWEIDGVPVAQASARCPVAGMSRIGPVYTPPEHRRHGYAAAVAAAATQWALDAGAERVLLFADLANATTTALYPRIGYRPVHDALELRFCS